MKESKKKKSIFLPMSNLSNLEEKKTKKKEETFNANFLPMHPTVSLFLIL